MTDALFDDAELGGIRTALERLQKLAPPPTSVTPATLEQWQGLEHLLGLQLPLDFKQLVDTYGTGCFAGFLWVCDPFHQWKHSQAQDDYITWGSKRLAALTLGQETFPQYAAPFPVHPAASGLLPWGFTNNGDTLCWQTIGSAANWPLILLDNKESEQYDHYPMMLTEFLALWLHQRIGPKTFPDDIFPVEEALFRSVNDA